MLSAIRRITVCAILLWLVSAATAPTPSPDTVTTATGDKLVGEIKRVEKDVLTLETDYSDLRLQDQVGQGRVDRKRSAVPGGDVRRQAPVGLVEGATRTKKAAVQVAGTSVPLAEVSAVQPFERSFWSRFDTALDFGYSMTRTNSAKQLSLGANLSYRDEHHVDVVFANVFRSSQDERARDAALGPRERLPPPPRQPLVRQHDPGLPEQRRAGPGSAHDDWRRRRAIPAALVVAVPGARGRAGVDQRELHGPGDARRRTRQRRISARSS